MVKTTKDKKINSTNKFTTLETPLYHILTTTDISLMWKVDDRQVKRDCTQNNLVEGIDYRKSGKHKLFSYASLYKLYGEPKINLSPFPLLSTSQILLTDVLTLAEAAEYVGKDEITLYYACVGKIRSGNKITPPRFTSNECRKSGSTWLITLTSLDRVFLPTYDFEEEKKSLGLFLPDIHSPINQVYTSVEAAKLWGKTKEIIASHCSGYKNVKPENVFNEGTDCRKSSKDWIITRVVLLRHFGPPLIPFVDPTDLSGKALHEVFTISEASQITHRSINAVQSACSGIKSVRTGEKRESCEPLLTPTECKKSGSTWLITHAGLTKIKNQVIKKTRTHPNEPYNFDFELQTLGEYQSNPITQIYTPTEAAPLWGYPQQKIADACRNKTLHEGIEYRKSSTGGKASPLLITRYGLLRVFGKPIIPFTNPTDTSGKALYQVITSSEATAITGKTLSTIITACNNAGKEKGKYNLLLTECRKSGSTWLILRTGIDREFLDFNRQPI